MADFDFKLGSRGSEERSLAGLEADVWKAVDRRARSERRLVTVGALQTGTLALALMAGLSWGVMKAQNSVDAAGLGVFSPQMALAPSTRLAGEPR
ncbi:MAG TPA: hypothetical protein VII63_03495 [Caulobacteraceae bacterium]